MWTFIISDLLYRNFQTQLFEILLFCLVKTGCFVEYNACYILNFVTAIILLYTKNISKKYAIANHKFPKECSDVISIQIDPHLKKLLNNTKGSRFYETRCIYCLLVCIVCFPTYPFFFTFLTYLLPHLSVPFRIGPLRFQARCCKRRLNLVLFLCVYFVL